MAKAKPFEVELIRSRSQRRTPKRQHRFRVRSTANGKIITWSELYENEADCRAMIEALHPDLPVVDRLR